MVTKENSKPKERKNTTTKKYSPRQRPASSSRRSRSEPFKLKVKLSNDEFRFLHILESLTGVLAYDCVHDAKRDWLIFIIPGKLMKRVIGPGGSTVQALSDHFKKNIDFVAFSRDKIEFIRNMFIPVLIHDVQFYDISKSELGKRMVIFVESEFHRRKIYSQDGRIIKRCELLSRRYFDVEEIVVKVK